MNSPPLSDADSTACRNVLIVGASGEIGAAIAIDYAKRGARLCLWGRDPVRLLKTIEACIAAGADAVSSRLLDIEDVAAACQAIVADDAATPFDCAVFAAGLGDVKGAGQVIEAADQVARLGIVNFVAPAAMASALGEEMAMRQAGRIVLIGSAAAFHALPFAAGYAGSKAGLARFADALRIGLKPHGVSVTMVSPGFVDTAAARRVPGPKPGILSPEVAANSIVAAAEEGVVHLVVPRTFVILRLLDRMLPRAMRDRLLRALAPQER
ncbi:SDR family NAD(P)-dependent oxidoreductase [Novosphingobium olei]|uniref:SDR family NAD(P)-dependent oxidoreductase n=1 Tax=Novosphingobium olei TaxID=2728851 RepID=A0A7Y0BL49_9SPHN|nr:SDR family NAD(P)-dependent oxidoreductase [Novosphingobium olei]NML92283.1 SDR family NAD(P)-dependent oxidoreductase [Novosphingobium olei]